MSAVDGAMALQLPTITIDDLRDFHVRHFPTVPVPEDFLHGTAAPAEEEEYYDYEDDGLGYYPDGVKRTLTDEQIALFRHTEIQTILRERRLKKEAEEEAKESASAAPPVSASPPVVLDGPTLAAAPSPGSPDKLADISMADASDATPAPMAATSDMLNKVQDGRVEKQSQWKERSQNQRTERKNARSRKKNRKKRTEDRKRKREGSVTTGKTGDDDDESDEWDPWHQANGPDVQKDTTVDLDY